MIGNKERVRNEQWCDEECEEAALVLNGQESIVCSLLLEKYVEKSDKSKCRNDRQNGKNLIELVKNKERSKTKKIKELETEAEEALKNVIKTWTKLLILSYQGIQLA